MEIIEPFQNETFFSWILRLSDWYGYSNLNNKDYYKNFMINLFGENTKTHVSLYIPSNINYAIKQINLPNNYYFKSTNFLTNHMTVFKFYKVFMTDHERERLLELFGENNEVINTERKLGVRSNTNYFENFPRIKFCSECIEEKKILYFQTDHQVQGNLVCYKHGIRLRYFLYNFKEIPNYSYINEVWGKAEYCIEFNEETINKYKVIAKMVHLVILDELSDSLIKIKSKLRKRLIDLGYMNEFYYIANIDEFFKTFEKYNLYDVTQKTLFYMIFNTGRKVNSIMYLSLIALLFGSLDEYNNYQIADEEIKDMKRSYSAFESLTKTPYTAAESFKHHANIIEERYGDEFTVLECGLKDRFLTIRHNSCGYTWKMNKNQVRLFKNCAVCFWKKRGYIQDS